MKPNKLIKIVLLGGLVLAACGPGAEYKKALKLEKKGEFYEAWQRYQNLVAGHPTHKLAPEALFRAGWVAEKGMGDCRVAKIFYERVRDRYPQADPWAAAAAYQVNNCPDLFPLIPGSRWVLGDSDSKGSIARTEITVARLPGDKSKFPSQAGKVTEKYFAGEKEFQSATFVYRKIDGELRQYESADDPRYKIVLKWPVEKDHDWSTRSQLKTFHYNVDSVDNAIEVSAGKFENVVKISWYVDGARRSQTNEYYAPGVGLILKTVTSGSNENRITELLSYNVATFDDFSVNESTDKAKEEK